MSAERFWGNITIDPKEIKAVTKWLKSHTSDFEEIEEFEVYDYFIEIVGLHRGAMEDLVKGLHKKFPTVDATFESEHEDGNGKLIIKNGKLFHQQQVWSEKEEMED